MLMIKMMKFGRTYKSKGLLPLIIFALTLFVFSCGDNSAIDTRDGALAGGGVGGTGVCVGSVSSFGSIKSNGIHFDTSNAEIIVEGQMLGKGDKAAYTLLEVGQMVRIEGEIHDDGTGVAEQVYYDKTIEGPVSSVEVLDPYTSIIVVLGQTVIVDSQTQFVDTSLEELRSEKDLAVTPLDSIMPGVKFTETVLMPFKHNGGQLLEISGLFSEDGKLKAGFVAKKKGVKTFTVTGAVSELDTDLQQFKMGELTIDYSEVTTPIPVFENGDKVRVKGRQTSGRIFKANDLMEWAPLDFRLDAERIKIQGVVHRSDSESDSESQQDIWVNDVAVHIGEHTTFDGIDSAAELDSGIEILVNGTLLNGVVQAETVEMKSDSIRSEGVVSSLDIEEATFTINDQLIRINQTTTIYKYSNSPCEEQIQIVDGVEEGDNVVVYGWLRTDDSITAKYIKINPQSSNCVQQCYWVYSYYYGGYVLYCERASSSTDQTSSIGGTCN